MGMSRARARVEAQDDESDAPDVEFKGNYDYQLECAKHKKEMEENHAKFVKNMEEQHPEEVEAYRLLQAAGLDGRAVNAETGRSASSSGEALRLYDNGGLGGGREGIHEGCIQLLDSFGNDVMIKTSQAVALLKSLPKSEVMASPDVKADFLARAKAIDIRQLPDPAEHPVSVAEMAQLEDGLKSLSTYPARMGGIEILYSTTFEDNQWTVHLHWRDHAEGSSEDIASLPLSDAVKLLSQVPETPAPRFDVPPAQARAWEFIIMGREADRARLIKEQEDRSQRM